MGDYRSGTKAALPPQGPQPEASGDPGPALDDADDAPPPEQRAFVLGADDHGVRLDRTLAQHVPEHSRNHLQSLIAAGHVLVDGQPESSASKRVRAGQRLSVSLVPPAEQRAYQPEPMALSVVYEDDDVLVIDKPAGLVVHPAAGNWTGTLLNGLLARDAAAAQLPRAGIVHRLDKDTSGLMVVGRTLAACTSLVRDIAARQVHRRYRAIAHGDAGAAPFTVDAPIGRDPVSRVKMAVTPGGKPAMTDVLPVAHCGDAEGRRYTALWCTLHTGRTHQIRVHLAHRGHPLVADATYGGKPAWGMTRQALHAAELSFAHPVSGAPLAFTAAAPPDFVRAWDAVTGAGAA